MELFQLPGLPSLAPRYNIAPTQPIAAVRTILEAASRELVELRWGLIPFWASDAKIGNTLINARSETVATKPTFRAAFRSRRCLVLADGFYEWQRAPDGKQPFHIQQRDGEPFAFAGLWEHWKSPDGEDVQTGTILTTSANDLMRPIHDRMPVILPVEAYDLWLDPAVREAKQLQPLLKPYDGELLSFPVSIYVNSPRHDDARCVEPLASTGPRQLFA